MSLRNTFIVGENVSVKQMFNKHPDYVCVDSLDDAEMVVFTGGADICPFIYGERPIVVEKGGHPVAFNVERDLTELNLYHRIPWSMHKVGICRGAQLLNVLAGGGLWQDVNNHTTEHEIQVKGSDGTINTVRVSSTHHQMMIPTEDATILAYGTGATRKLKQGAIKNLAEDAWADPEILYNWTNNSLCFQPHPEYGPDGCTRLFFDLLQEMFFAKKKG